MLSSRAGSAEPLQLSSCCSPATSGVSLSHTTLSLSLSLTLTHPSAQQQNPAAETQEKLHLQSPCARVPDLQRVKHRRSSVPDFIWNQSNKQFL